MTQGYVSIGSNIERDGNFPSGLRALRRAFGPLTISSIYETEPVGFSGDLFYNAVVGFNSERGVTDIASDLRQIELAHGRNRNCRKFSARTLDLDLLVYGDAVLDAGGLKLPRAEIERYAFVLEPLAEIAGALRHPVSGVRYDKMWEAFDKTGVRQWKVRPDWLAAFV